jgi:hypothetical protein
VIALEQLSDEEAEAAVEAFAKRMPGRLEEFRRQVAAEAGPDPNMLDVSPESLVPLWGWFVELARAVDSGKRRAPGWDGSPPWYAPDPPNIDRPLPDWTAWVIDGLAYYWAATFQRSYPEMHWELGNWPKRLHVVEQNHPMLRGHGIQMSPLHLMDVKVSGVIKGGVDHEPDALLRLYRRWASQAGPGRAEAR